jgi:DNA invertase Pin-like site-specific DNA recombinase
VLVWRYDRFARSTQALVQALNEFHSLGVDFISYGQNALWADFGIVSLSLGASPWRT